MQTLFALLLLASMAGILLGLIKPSLVLHWGKKRTRLRAVGWYALFTVVFIVAIGFTPTIRDFSTGFSEGFKESMGQQSAEKTQSAPAEKVVDAKPSAPVQKAEAVPSKPTDTPEKFQPGVAIPVGKFIYTINGVKFAKRLGNSVVNETADGIFLLVDMTILNNDSETRMLDDSLFKIKDVAGTEYEPASRAATTLEMSGGKAIMFKQCQPKIPTKGVLVFEVPAQGQPYFLELSGGYWSSQHAQVALQ